MCDGSGVWETIEEAVAVRPRGPLGRVVAQHHGYRQEGMPAGQHLGLPSPFLTVIFTLDTPLRIAQHVDHARPAGEYATVVGGLHTKAAVIEHDGAQSGIQVQLSPLGARGLFGMPAGELAGLDADGTEVFGALASQVQERLASTTTWFGRFALLDQVLGSRLDLARVPAMQVCAAWQLLNRRAGQISTASIADEVGWSERHLARQFQIEVGLTPKVAARVIRFDRARRMLPYHPGAEVAARCGYADQSHLVREFVDFAGLSPTRWLAAEVRNVQATRPEGRHCGDHG